MSGKSFKTELEQSPATAFITMPEDEGQKPIKESIADNEEIRELITKHREELEKLFGAEKKTRKVNLLLKPSIYERLKRKAESEGDTVNNLINELLEKALSGGAR